MSNTSPRTLLHPTAVIGTGTKRQLIAEIIGNGQPITLTALASRVGSPTYAVRGRLSELRGHNFVISHENGIVQFHGISV